MTGVLRQMQIPAVYMRGGTSKGVFFRAEDLPEDRRARDEILLRVMGSPDPYEKQIDGMGGASSSTSKVVIIGKSERTDCDVDYLFGQVSVAAPLIDWRGNCGNLSAAVGPFAISRGLVRAPRDGAAVVRIWQANIEKRIIAHVPMLGGEVLELGDFVFDGVAFPAAEIKLEFLDPGASGAMFPTGNRIDALPVPGEGVVQATLINAGNPTAFVLASALGLTGTELQSEINGQEALLARFEAIRAHASVAMGLADSVKTATANRPTSPRIAFIGPAAPYMAASGKPVAETDVDLLVRIISMGQLHHAMTGTGAVAIAAAAAVPDTLVSQALAGARASLRFGHPSGTLGVGADAVQTGDGWSIAKVVVSRSARRLMEGRVLLPGVAAGCP